jgi:lipoate-protein ligase A
MCFHHSTPLDIAWAGADGVLRKGVGSAQRRSKGRVLHHGSIKLGTSPLEGRIATLKERLVAVDLHDVAQALRASFTLHFRIELEAAVPDAVERDEARELGKRYVDPGFVRRR